MPNQNHIMFDSLRKEDVKFVLKRFRNRFHSLYLDVYCLLAKVLHKKEEDKEKIFINRLYFEVSNVCNLRCKFCVYSKKVPTRFGNMSFDVFKKAIDEFAGLGGEIVSFTPTIGEPLMDPGLIDKVKYALKLPNIKNVYFYTNGTLLAKNDNYKKLIDAGIHRIEVSLAGFDKEVYKRIHQADFYEQMLEGIRKLLDYNKLNGNKTEVWIDFRSPVLPSKALTAEDFQKYIKPYLSTKVHYSFLVDYDNWCGNIKPEDLSGVMTLRRSNKFKYFPCSRTYDAAILFDGSVRLCACRVKDTEFDELVVGNINNDSLKDIFYSERAKKVRESFISNNLLPVCKECSLYVPAAVKLASRKKARNYAKTR